MINFLIEFILWLFVSSIFCNGWYLITRGYYAQMPDYSQVKAGEVFGFWERFWEKQIGHKRNYFSEKARSKKFSELDYMDKALSDKFFFIEGYWQLKIGSTLSEKEQIRIENLLSCKMYDISNEGSYNLYYEVPKYLFPMWVQKPVSRCVVCYASVYGTLLWLVFIQQKNLFDWFYYKKAGYIVFWFIFIVSLSWLNSYLNKKIKQ